MDWFDMLLRRRERLALFAAGQEPAGHAADPGGTASLDPIRDQGRAYAAACVEAGVRTAFVEAEGTVHGFINLRRAIPSAADDIAQGVAALKQLLGEAGR